MAKKQGRGWHGNSLGHAAAGRKGGQARQSNRANSQGRKNKQSSSNVSGSYQRGTDREMEADEMDMDESSY